METRAERIRREPLVRYSCCSLASRGRSYQTKALTHCSAHHASHKCRKTQAYMQKAKGLPGVYCVALPMGLSQSYPRQPGHHPQSPPNSAQHYSQHRRSPRSPPLPHSNTQPIPSANLPARRPTNRARSHSRGNIEDFQYLTGLIVDNPPAAGQTHRVTSGMLDSNAPGFTRRVSPKRDVGLSGGATDDYVSRGSYASQSSGVVGRVEDQVFVSEDVVFDKEPLGEGEGEKGKPKPQRRGSVKKLADTLENVARRSPSLHSLKRFSGPPRLGSPVPSPGLPCSVTWTPLFLHLDSLSSGSGNNNRNEDMYELALGHVLDLPLFVPHLIRPTPPPTITHSSTSSHSQGPYSTPVLYREPVLPRSGRFVRFYRVP